MNKFAPVLAAVAAILSAPLAYSEVDALTVRVTPIKGPLHLLQGRGGNVVASVGDDGVLVIDSDYGEYAEAYGRAIQDLTNSDETPRFLLNTHWHFDHTGGNSYWGERNTVIIGHDNIRERMSTRQDMKAVGRVVEPSPEVALPVITFGDSLALHFNGDDIEVQHYATGHTDGDSIVFFTAENVVHMGDHYFKGAFPFVDIGSGGNVFGFIANIDAVLARVDDNTVIVPGHGKTSATRKDLEGYRAMLVTTSGIVKTALEKGQTIEQITEQGLGEEWASYGQGFIKEASWISFIAESLQVLNRG